MPIARFQMPDGRIARFEVPEGTTPDQAQEMISGSMSAPKKSSFETIAQDAKGLENLLPAIGGAMTGAYLGGKQRVMQALDTINPQESSRAAAMESDIAENRAAMKGLNSTKVGMVGDVIGNLAVAAPTMLNPAAATMKGAAIIGGGMGALRPTLNDESVLGNVATGAALGAGGQWLGNKLMGAAVGQRGTSASGGTAQATSSGGSSSASSTVTGGATATGKGGGYNFGTVGDDVSAGLNTTQKGVMNRATQLGYKMTPGQASGSKSLQQLEAKLESQPMTSGRFNEIKSGNQTVTNRIAADSIGEASDVVDSAVLAKAHDRISNVYKLVADDTKRAIDPEDFIGRLSAIEGEFEGLLPAGSVLNHPLVDRLYSFAGQGGATGRQLQNIASKLGRAAKNEMTGNGDRELGMALSQAKELADDLLQQGLTGQTATLFKTARQQYRNTMLLTDRLGVVNPSNGNVSAAALANVLSKDKAGFIRGGNTSPLYDAARFGQGFKPIAGDSGTATRSALPSPTDFVLSLPFNVVTHAYTSNPVINMAVKGGSVRANGLLSGLDPAKVKYLPMIGAAAGVGSGGLLSVP